MDIFICLLITPITDRRVTPTLVRQYQISCGNQIITLNYQKILNVCAKIEYFKTITIYIYIFCTFLGSLWIVKNRKKIDTYLWQVFLCQFLNIENITKISIIIHYSISSINIESCYIRYIDICGTSKGIQGNTRPQILVMMGWIFHQLQTHIA